MVGAGLMEKIMSKSNDSSKLGHAKIEDRALADAELGAVTGGMGFGAFAFIVAAVCQATLENAIITQTPSDGPIQCPR
jgi:hypothetical protein